MRYIPALDGIRGIAILMVVTRHMGFAFFKGGFLGVDVFFVLSGYLITTILLREHTSQGGISFGSFYLRRARRLYPALITMLLAVLFVLPILFERPPIRVSDTSAWHAAMYLTDFTHPWGVADAGYLKHIWSLSVEEQFYLLWPLVLTGLLRLDRAAALRILAYAYVGQTIARYLLSLTDWEWEKIYMSPFTHSTGLILGTALALAPPIKIPSKRTTNLLAIGVLLYLIQISVIYQAGIVDAYAYNITLTEWGTVFLILSARSRSATWLASPPLVRLGLYSYGIYLWHCLMIPIVSRLIPGDAGIWAGACASLVIAVISYHTIEMLFRSQRRAGGLVEVDQGTSCTVR